MKRSFFLTLAVICMSFNVLGAQEAATLEAPKGEARSGVKAGTDVESKTPSLEDAKTMEEIQEYLSNAHAEFRKEMRALTQTGDMIYADIGLLFEKTSVKIIAVGKKMLQIAKEDDEKAGAYQTIMQGLGQLDQSQRFKQIKKLQEEAKLSDEDLKDPVKSRSILEKIRSFETDAQKEVARLADEIETTGKFQSLVNNIRFEQFQRRSMGILTDFSPEKFPAFKKEAMQWINKANDPSDPVMMIIDAAESEKATATAPGLGEKTVKELIAFVESKDCTVQDDVKKEIVEQLLGYCRRCIGSDPKLYGKTLDDKDFDWAVLRGKVVLVKFTASWCGPCKMQIPAMLKAYEKYKDKGFEIVSVYVMDKLPNVQKVVEEEKLPWIILSEELTQKADQSGQGQFYGIRGVPTMLLVGKDGKIVDNNARGDSLDEKLGKLLGSE